MAITPLQRKKIQRALVLVLLLVVFVTTAVVWWGFFKASTNLKDSALPLERRVEVDTGILSNPIFEELENPRAPAQIPSEVGRDNPFLPAP